MAAVAQEKPRQLTGHKRVVFALAFSPDGQSLASSDYDSTVRIWKLADGTSIKIAVEGDSCRSLAYAPDGKILAGTARNKILLWNAADGALADHLYGDLTKDYPVSRIAFSPDGKILAAAHDGGWIRLWDAATWKPLGELRNKEITGNPKALAFSPDGRLLALGSSDHACGWDVAAKSLVRIYAKDREFPSIAFASDGRTIVAGDSDGNVRAWETATGKELVKSAVRRSATATALLTDKIVVCLDTNDHFVFFDLDKGKLSVRSETPEVTLGVFALSPDRKRVAYAPPNGSENIVFLQTFKEK